MNIKAFPTDVTNGMDLRDYFAAKAMEAIINKMTPNMMLDIAATEDTATEAYYFADAMMEARKQ